MRRSIFLIVAVLECAIAAVLIFLGRQLPSEADLAAGFGSAGRVTAHAEQQVKLLRRQVQELRRPELLQLAERLQSQTLNVTGNLKEQQLDFDGIHTMRNALAEIAQSLDVLARNIDAPAGDMRAAELRQTLRRSAALLRTGVRQLDEVLKNRNGYEDALRHSVLVAETFAAALPILTEQLDLRLAEEEHALDELEASLKEVRTALPVYRRMAQHLTASGRLLAWLTAAVVGLHGCYLGASIGLGRRYSL
ncbi:MAG: hypothetical protein JNM56_11070 [Planctomycetia bacterium]|nr:hypothetical protein [Planctomycetia bacterium]